jgi:hypothetical protein
MCGGIRQRAAGMAVEKAAKLPLFLRERFQLC